jgi:chemotaxis protein methyltransferase CheR
MALSDPEFRSLSARIAETVGIHIATEKRWLLAARVKERLASTGDPDEARYVERVLDDAGAEELGRLVEALRVGETQFYRHRGQLRAIERVALPEIVARRQRDGTKTVRVWSAGCASGEEPYTMAMLLDAFLADMLGMSFEILATDLSASALDTARRARYPAGAIRGVPPEVAEAAFQREGDDVLVRPALKSRVRFELRNLLHAPYPAGFDLVLCRNVLIYFGRATQMEVLGRLARAVIPGGYLALGYTERLDAGDGELLPLRTDDGVLYRRDDGTNRVVLPPPKPRRRSRPPKNAPAEPSSKAPIREHAPRPVPTPRRRSTIPPPPSTSVPHLSGALEGPDGVRVARAALAPLVAGDAKPLVLSVEGLVFADADVVRVLARAAAALAAQGETLSIAHASSGVRHFLVRHGVVPPARIFEDDDGEAG